MQVEEGWWEGLLNGKSGMFPSNFTKEILLEDDGTSADTPASQEEPHSARNSETQPIETARMATCLIVYEVLGFFFVCVQVRTVQGVRAMEQTLGPKGALLKSSPKR